MSSPVSTFFGLQQSLRGLLAHQRAMDVTGHDITNANTQGYSRQEAIFSSGTPYEVEAEAARARSAELRGLLDEIVREHGINRALMRQELAFLDHLVRLIGDEPEDGYRPDSGPRARSPHRVLDLQA